MSEEQAIKNTKSVNSVDTLTDDLRKLGVHQGDLVLVHSSLSRIGWVCGGAMAVILGLFQAIGNTGTLVMPEHSGDWSDPADWMNPPVPKEWVPVIYETMPAFDPNMTPSRGMGKIAELFRTLPGAIRSSHPQVSFSAVGPMAKTITEPHELTPSLGMRTPLGSLYENGGKVLLLGVGFESCTAFHLAETLCEAMPRCRQGTALAECGKRIWKWYEDFEYDADDFPAIGKEFLKTDVVQTGFVGNAPCFFFDMKTGVDFAKAWMMNHRFSGII